MTRSYASVGSAALDGADNSKRQRGNGQRRIGRGRRIRFFISRGSQGAGGTRVGLSLVRDVSKCAAHRAMILCFASLDRPHRPEA